MFLASHFRPPTQHLGWRRVLLVPPWPPWCPPSQDLSKHKPFPPCNTTQWVLREVVLQPFLLLWRLCCVTRTPPAAVSGPLNFRGALSDPRAGRGQDVQKAGARHRHGTGAASQTHGGRWFWSDIVAERLPRRKELLSTQTPHRRLLRFCCHVKQKDTSSKCQANKKCQAADNKGWGKCKRTVICRPRKKKSVVRREGGRRGKARERTDQQRERRRKTQPRAL